jgi:hypothetical protein
MHSLLATIAFSASLTVIATTLPAYSMTMTAPTGIRPAAEALDLTESVHCRRYAHRHRRGHGWSRGCSGRAVIVAPRRGVVIRERSTQPGVRPLPRVAPSRGNVFNPSNPQDRSGGSNPQDLTQPRSFNPQDMRAR